MYNALTPLFNHVTSQDLLADFKPDYLGGAAVGPFTIETVPHPGVTIKLDPYDVPQIIGKTRDDVTWGAGWIEAQDRGTLMEEARGDAAVAAIDAPGLSALNLIAKLETFQPSAQTERVIARPDRGAEGGWGGRSRRAARPARLPPGNQRLHSRQRRHAGALRARRSVHARRHLRLQRAQGPVRRRGRRAAGRQRRVPVSAAPAARGQEGDRGLQRSARGQRPRGAGQRPRPRPVPAAAHEHLGQRAAGSRQPVGERQPCARGAARSSRCTPPTRCWCRPSGQRPTTRSWSPARRSATTTRA